MYIEKKFTSQNWSFSLTFIDTQTQLNIEYPINVSEQLKGSFDYYISSSNSLLVVEAKQSDLSRGFTQLAIELIALDQWTDSQTQMLIVNYVLKPLHLRGHREFPNP